MADLRIFFSLLEDSPPSRSVFPIIASPGISVGELKRLVYAEALTSLKGIDARNLTLWKLKVPLPVERVDEVTGLGQDPALSAVAVEMHPMEDLSDHFPAAPPPKRLHVIVQPPSLPSAGQKHGLSDDDTDREPPSKRKKAGSKTLVTNREWCERQDTVGGILELLHKHRLVQIRGTSASGKTTLMYLLHARIVKAYPNAEVFIQAAWPKEFMKGDEERIVENLSGYPSFEEGERYFLFDEGQTTYWDNLLWAAFKNTIQNSDKKVYAILFCSHGNEDITDDPVAPRVDFGAAKVTLERTDRGASKPCGLLLDDKEFSEVIRRKSGKLLLADNLCTFVYHFTRGHVGATVAVIQFLLKKKESSMLKGVTYSLEEFHEDTASYDEFCRHLSMDHGVARGIPKRPAKYAHAMRALLLHGSIGCDDKSVQKYIRSNLHRGYKHGFVNLDEANRYTFASPLYQQLWSWHLLPQTGYQLPHRDLISFVKDTVSRFRSSQLDQSDRQAGSATHRPPEAQYQEEYYRCVHNLTRGDVRISPEYAAAAGSRPGRIDFFIPSKKWGIELTRDGSKLNEHATRFANGGVYGQWLQSSDMADYVLLDFRSTIPVQTHAGVRNLYHVVFRNNNTQVEIYDNQLSLKAREDLMQQ